MPIFVYMLNSTQEPEQRTDLLSRYHALEIDFNNKIDLLGLEFRELLDKDLFDIKLSQYCKKFTQVGSKSISVRFMIPSELGLPASIRQKMEKVFNDTFPNNEFR